MIPIAHRGYWWPESHKQNTVEAILAAFANGWGVEFDVFSDGPYLTIRHDSKPVHCAPSILLDDVFRKMPTPPEFPPLFPRLFINIKEPLIEDHLLRMIGKYGLASMCAIFDYELVGDKEMGKRIKRTGADITVLVRASDRPGEHFTDALDNEHADGLWVDTFNNSEWVSPSIVQAIREAGKKSYIVSPELHNRPLDLMLWMFWKGADGVCTDFPHLWEGFFDPLYKKMGVEKYELTGTARALFPKEPWW